MKKLSVLLIAVIIFVSALLSGAYGELFTVSYTTYDTTYEEILNMYIRVLNANGDDGHHHDLFNDLIWNDFHHANEDSISNRTREAKSRVGYCIYDLNGDGIDELIIGENYSYVNEVFTMDHGKVRELIRAGMKYNCALLEDGCFYRHTRDGGALESSVVWKMDGTSAVQFYEGYRKDDEFGSDWSKGISHENQWFIMRNGDDYAPRQENIVPVEEYLTWLKGWDQKLLPLSFVPLAVYEQGITSDNIGIVSVGGKTNGKDTVNIRKEARKNSGLVKTVKTGTYVSILGEEENYYRISFSGLEGFIQKDFLTVITEVSAEQNHSIYSDAEAKYILSQKETAPVITSQPAEPEHTDQPEPTAASSDSEYYYESVLDHYESVEVQRSRQVYDHDEYTYVDNGDGTYREVSHPVYRTEYYTETEQRPVYRQELRKNGE